MKKTTELYRNLSKHLGDILRSPGNHIGDAPGEWQPHEDDNRAHPAAQSKEPIKQESVQSLPFDTDQKNIFLQWIFESAQDGVFVLDARKGTVIEANPYACSKHGYSYDEFIGLRISAFILPDYLAHYKGQAGSTSDGNFLRISSTHKHRNGSLLYFDVGISEFQYQEKPCLVVLIHDIQEIKERIKSEQFMQKRVENRIQEQTTLLEISQTLSSTLDLDPELILEQLRKIVSFTHAALFTIQDTSLIASAVCGMPSLEETTPIEIHLGGSGTPKIFFNGHQTTRISNIWGNDPEAVYLRSLLTEKASIFLEGVKSWMWVPLIAKGRILGGLGIAHEQSGYFSVHHADLAQTIANQAAITMVNAELYEHAQMYATLQERQRLARNLHDAVNQSLFSANLIAEVLPRLWEKNPEEGRRSLENLRRLTNGAMSEMRMMMAELRPLSLIDDDLGNLLHLLADAFTGRSNIPVKVSVFGKAHLPSEVQVGLYRLCQEGLNNIAKHSNATVAEIILQSQNNSVKLLIRDNGCGFEPSNVTPGHYGLNIMRERADAIGADLSIKSAFEQGCEIEIYWSE